MYIYNVNYHNSAAVSHTGEFNMDKKEDKYEIRQKIEPQNRFSISDKCGLVLSVSAISKQFKTDVEKYNKLTRKTSSIYLTSVIEYVIRELIEQSLV